MNVCLDCGCLFEEGKHYTETHGLDSPPYEEWNGCPSCGGTYEETFECDVCGEYITSEYAEVKDHQKICEACYQIKCIGE